MTSEQAQMAARLRAQFPSMRYCIHAAGEDAAREIAAQLAGILAEAGWTEFSSPVPARYDDGVRLEFGDDVTGMGRYFSPSAAAALALVRELGGLGIVARRDAGALGDCDLRIVIGPRARGS